MLSRCALSSGLLTRVSLLSLSAVLKDLKNIVCEFFIDMFAFSLFYVFAEVFWWSFTLSQRSFLECNKSYFLPVSIVARRPVLGHTCVPPS